MGQCNSNVDPSEADSRKKEEIHSRVIEAMISEAQDKECQINKLLLLGAGASGKSTLFKQMTTIYGKGFSDEDKSNYDPVISHNIISSMKQLCVQSTKFGKVEEKNEDARDFILAIAEDHCSLKDYGNLDNGEGDTGNCDTKEMTVGTAIKQLWGDSGIQKTFLQRSKYYLNDSADYYFNELDRVLAEGYTPSDQDILRSRVPTTGIVENTFDIDGNLFKMFDVGGQRSERKKMDPLF